MTQRIHTLQIFRDSSPESPREWDNLGTMACWHGRYILGDKQPLGDPQEHRINLVCEMEPDFEDWLKQYADYLYTLTQDGDHIEEQCNEFTGRMFDHFYISLPLYLYDHSGITMSTGAFTCSWDSGQVGFIYVRRDEVEREFTSEYPAHGHDTLEKHIEAILRREVEMYDQYLTGDVYGFVLVDEHGEEVDSDLSCWGFYGRDYKTNGIADHVDLDTVKAVHFMEPVSSVSYQPADIEELT